MMEVGNKHEYTGVEHKKEKSVDERDDDNEGEKETEGGNDIFVGVKQVNVHAQVDGYGDVVIFQRRRRR